MDENPYEAPEPCEVGVRPPGYVLARIVGMIAVAVGIVLFLAGMAVAAISKSEEVAFCSFT